MNKTHKLMLIFVAFLAFLIAAFTFIAKLPFNDDIGKVVINQNVSEAYNATCRIDIEYTLIGMELTSTGVLLDTGYVLTAAHCIDGDADGVIDRYERSPQIKFYGDIASVHTGSVVFVGEFDSFDIAVIELENPPPSKVTLADTNFGDMLFTIGMTKSSPPNISTGLASSYSAGHARASIAAWVGNSGGGIWTKDQQLAGIASRIALGQASSIVTIPVPTDEGVMVIQGKIKSTFALSNWLWYADAHEIREGLDNRSLTFVYKTPEPQSQLSVYNSYARMSISILGVLACAIAFKKHLFS